MVSKEEVFDIIGKHLDIKLRIESKQYWDNIESKSPFVMAEYSYFFVSYCLEYNQNILSDYNDISVVIFNNRQAVGIWPLSYYKRERGGDIL